MTDAGLAAQTANLVYQDYAQLQSALRAWLRDSDARAGIFAGNDIYALQVLAALRDLGVSVPAEAGVIGFDNTSTGRYLTPQLSSVSQPIDLMAREAVSRLMYRIEHPGRHPALDMPLQASLAARESS